MKTNRIHNKAKSREDLLYSKNNSLDNAYNAFFKTPTKAKEFSGSIPKGFVSKKK